MDVDSERLKGSAVLGDRLALRLHAQKISQSPSRGNAASEAVTASGRLGIMVLTEYLNKRSRQSPGSAEFLAERRVQLLCQGALQLGRSDEGLGQLPTEGIDQPEGQRETDVVENPSGERFLRVDVFGLGNDLGTDSDGQPTSL
jgi:hypothetical protein